LKRGHAAGDAEAIARVEKHLPGIEGKLILTKAQAVIAREYGFESWAKLRTHTLKTKESNEAKPRWMDEQWKSLMGPKQIPTLLERDFTAIESDFVLAGATLTKSRWTGMCDVDRMAELLRQEPKLIKSVGPLVLKESIQVAGCADAVKFLMDHGVPLEIDDTEYNVLHEAAWTGECTENLRHVFESGAADAAGVAVKKPHAGWADNIPLIYWASWRGVPEMAKLLLKHGGDVHLDLRLKNNGSEGHTALQVAAAPGPWDRDAERHAIARMLIERGAYFDIFSACGLDDVDRLNELLREDGDAVHAVEEFKSTPLHWATRKNALRCAKGLIDAGADVNASNGKGSTPLDFAVAYNDFPDMVRLLAENGADLDAQDPKGRTPLHRATYEGRVESAEALIELGASTRKRNRSGKTPLQVARKGCSHLKPKAPKKTKKK
jgi:ankyrin repeat protein